MCVCAWAEWIKNSTEQRHPDVNSSRDLQCDPRSTKLIIRTLREEYLKLAMLCYNNSIPSFILKRKLKRSAACRRIDFFQIQPLIQLQRATSPLPRHRSGNHWQEENTQYILFIWVVKTSLDYYLTLFLAKDCAKSRDYYRTFQPSGERWINSNCMNCFSKSIQNNIVLMCLHSFKAIAVLTVWINLEKSY